MSMGAGAKAAVESSDAITFSGIWTAVLTSILPTLGFLLALLLLSQIIRERKAPANAMAWLVGIIAMPYVAVPLYLLVGKRKIRRYEKAMVREHRHPNRECDCPDRVLLDHKRRGIFAATCGNQLDLIYDGKSAFEETVEAIRGATDSIFIATYIFDDDATGCAIRDELARSAAEGIEVRVLIDAYGAMWAKRSFFKPIEKAGGHVAFHGSMFRLRGRSRANLRNHRKLMICDGTTAIFGGMNIAQQYMGTADYKGRWRDLAATLKGPAVADIHDVFLADWKFATDQELEPFTETSPIADKECEVLAQVIASGPDVDGDPLHEALLVAFYEARERIWIVTPYFVPDTSLMHALSIAQNRGIDVRILTPRRSNHFAADLARAGYLRQLDEQGVSVLMFEKGMIHAKAIIVDSNLALLGSANIDMRSLFLNFELTVCTRSKEINAELEQWMSGMMASSSRGLPYRGGPLELLEGVGRLLAPLL